MKKILSVFLAVLMLISVCSIAANAEGEELIITVANDLHYNTNYTKPAVKKNDVNADFAHIGLDSTLIPEAYAILDSFLEQAGKNESSVVIIPGDITDRGSAQEMEDITAMFREFEATYNKQIYVVPGNHDLLRIKAEQFKQLFAEFGYNEAVEVDSNSASYVADLPGDYRLIAIDSCAHKQGGHAIDSARLDWIAKQGEKAKAEGKKLIGMQHHNLLEHVVLASLIHSTSMVSAKVKNAPDVYAKAGIKYIFTAHTHDHDIATYTADDGSVIYDAVTGSLDSTGSLYRVVTFGDNVKFETRNIQKVNPALLPEGISDNARNIAATDFAQYCEIATDLNYSLIFNHYTTAKVLKSLLKLEDEEMNSIIDKVGNRLNEALNMPFEKADEVEAGKSIETIVEQYETFIPDSDYKNMIDLAVTLYQAHNIGDENYPAYSDEVVLLTRGLAAALSYTLSEVSAEEYAKVLSFLAGLLDLNISVDFLKYAGDGIKRFEGIEIFITTAILPLIADFTTDDAPGDCNVTLPGYEAAYEESELTFFEKIANFFKMLMDALRTMFAFLPFWN